MKLFLVSYDLDSPGQDYGPLTKELGRLGKRITLSDWVVEVATRSAAQLRDVLRTYIDANDRLAVIELPVGLQWATYNGLVGGVGLLRRHRPFYS